MLHTSVPMKRPFNRGPSQDRASVVDAGAGSTDRARSPPGKRRRAHTNTAAHVSDDRVQDVIGGARRNRYVNSLQFF